MPVIVVPVEGFYLNDVPAAEQEVTKARAAELVKTGAFRYQGDPPDAADYEDPGPADEAGPPDSGS